MHVSENTLLDFSLGLLSPAEAGEVETHVDGCEECRALVAACVRAEQPVNEAAPSSLPARGATVGRYLIIDSIGTGGMGVVYSAYDPVLDRKVAIKFLHGERRFDDPTQARARLHREAQSLARVAHPNVVAVYDVGTVGEQVFFAMEFVNGRDLADFLAGRRDPGEVIELFRQAGRGLAAVHGAGLVHRDFKASNVLVDERGRVRITDFGLARLELSAGPSGGSVGSSPSLTQTGALLGTPAYMAPEQHLGRQVDARSDQFAFCVALYEALYGELPFGVLPVDELAQAVVSGRVLDAPRGSHVPVWVRRTLLRGLSVDPGARFASMEALVEALGRNPRLSRRRRVAAALVGTLGTVLLAGVWWAAPERRYCAGLDAPMTRAWGLEEHARLKAVFSATGALGPDAWRSVEEVLNDYSQAWVERRVEACRATRVRGEQSEAAMDLRVECLDRRLVGFTALLRVFEDADLGVVQHATEAAHSLDKTADCDDGAALRRLPPLPRDTRAQLASFELALADTAALLKTDRLTQGLAKADALLTAASSMSYPPAVADAHLLRGRLLAQLERLSEAEVELRQALGASLAANDQVRTLSSLVELALAISRGSATEAGHLIELALAISEPREDVVALAETLSVASTIETRASDFARALELAERSLEILEKHFGPQSPRLAKAVVRRASALESLGRYAEAEAGLTRGVSLFRQEFGAFHPNVGNILSTLCLVQHRLRHSDDAERSCRQSLEIYARLSPDFPAMGLTLTHLGVVYVQQGKVEAAIEAYTHAIAVMEKGYGPEYPPIATALNNRANALARLGRREEAETDYVRSLALREKVLAPGHASIAESIFNLAELRRRQGRCREALAFYERALAIDEKRLGSGHPFIAGDLFGLGECSRLAGTVAAAVPLLERALEISLKGVDPEEHGNIRFALARALAASPATVELGRALAQQAHHDFERCGKNCTGMLAELTRWVSASR